MVFFYVLILTQIVLESLPVSSSGHVALIEHILLHFFPTATDQYASWLYLIPMEHVNHLLHLPTLLCVFIFFRSYGYLFFRLLRSSAGRAILFTLCAQVMAVDTITLFFYRWYKPLLISFPVWAGFLTTGLLLYAVKWMPPIRRASGWRMLIVGCAQGLAFTPGISRLASVFVASRWAGFRPLRAYVFAWAVHMPLMGAAVCKSAISVVRGAPVPFFYSSFFWGVLSVGTIAAYGALHVGWHVMKNNRTELLALYMVGAALVAFLFIT